MRNARLAVNQVLADVRRGGRLVVRLAVSSSGLFLIGLLAALILHPGLRQQAEQGVEVWRSLQEQTPESPLASVPVPDVAPEPVAPVEDPDPLREHAELFLGTLGDASPFEQLPVAWISEDQLAALERHISRRFLVAPDAARMLVKTAVAVGHEFEIDPLLILAVIAIESRFNPFAQSGAGAQGLMQIMTRVHVERFEPFGGPQAAFNPVANIWVGASILREYVRRGGSLDRGLRMYVGVGPDGETRYPERVLGEKRRLQQAIGGELAVAQAQQEDEVAAEATRLASAAAALSLGDSTIGLP